MNKEISSFLHPEKIIHAAMIHEGQKVADFGCGSGFFTRAAARAVGQGGVVWAVDAHRDILEHVTTLAKAEGLHNIKPVAADVEHRMGSMLHENSVDVVIATNILFSAHDKQALVENIWKVLKGGGRALVIDWKESFGGLGPHKEHVVTEKDARALFEKGGFTYLGELPAGAYHWGFSMRKK